MEIGIFLLGVILGGVILWKITQAYYNKSSKDRIAVFKKLPEEVRYAILKDNRKNLSIQELNELLREKTPDRNVE